MVRVKICGLTRVSDALAAAECGAHAIGLMFFQRSPRHVGLGLAMQIAAELPPFVSRVGVFVDAPEEEVWRAVEECGLDTLQFHGQESPEYCERFKPLSVVKAFRIRDAESLQPLEDYRCDAWLLDSYVAGAQGGTGECFNWDLALEAGRQGRPIILAGGLNPDNVAEAVRRVGPYAVDVSSGVEVSPGVKDSELMKAFMKAVGRTSW